MIRLRHRIKPITLEVLKEAFIIIYIGNIEIKCTGPGNQDTKWEPAGVLYIDYFLILNNYKLF
jgi:hypothetical protein